MTQPARTLEELLVLLRHTTTQLQSICTDLLNVTRAAGLADVPIRGEDDRRITGYRFVRGSHGGTYKKDPTGTDRLPSHQEAPR